MVSTVPWDTPAAPAARSRPCLLFVDDEVDITASYQLLLELEGFNVVVADNGFDALRVVEQQRPDVIVTDMMMPVMNGAELCRRLRGQSGTQNIPIIMTSALVPPATAPGPPHFDEFIRKPVEVDRLLQRIRALLDRQTDRP